jgi:hypothetical protein
MTNSQKHLQLIQNEYNELLRLKVLGYFMVSDIDAVNNQLSILENEIHTTKSWINKDFLTAKN